MRKALVISLMGLAAVSAYGVGLGAGGFYMFSTEDFGAWWDPSFLGGGAKVSVGVLPAVSVDVGFGYNMKYKEQMPYVLSPPAGTDLNNWYMTTIPITFGPSYKFDLGKFKPYVGAGGVYAMRKRHYELVIDDPETPTPIIEPKTISVNKPGFYVGGGVMYGLTDKLFLDVNPRFLMLMYNEAEDADVPPSISKDEGNPMFFDVLIGVDYFFM